MSKSTENVNLQSSSTHVFERRKIDRHLFHLKWSSITSLKRFRDLITCFDLTIYSSKLDEALTWTRVQGLNLKSGKWSHIICRQVLHNKRCLMITSTIIPQIQRTKVLILQTLTWCQLCQTQWSLSTLCKIRKIKRI